MFRKLRITCVLGKEMEVEGGGGWVRVQTDAYLLSIPFRN